jgi:hypothetical protein
MRGVPLGRVFRSPGNYVKGDLQKNAGIGQDHGRVEMLFCHQIILRVSNRPQMTAYIQSRKHLSSGIIYCIPLGYDRPQLWSITQRHNLTAQSCFSVCIIWFQCCLYTTSPGCDRIRLCRLLLRVCSCMTTLVYIPAGRPEKESPESFKYCEIVKAMSS